MKPYKKIFTESDFNVKLKCINRAFYFLETLTGKSFSIQDKSGMIEILRKIDARFSEKNEVSFLNGSDDADVIMDYVKDESEVILNVNAEKFKKLVNA